MILRNVRGRVLLLLSAGSLAFAMAAPAAAQEQRCNELGSNCLCSEPLQDTTTRSIRDRHDFADSPDAKECKPYETSSSRVRTINEFGMPAGNTVDRVLEIPEDGASVNWIRGEESAPSSTKRMCVRYYATYDENFSGVGQNGAGCPSERNKMVQFGFQGANVQLQEAVNPQGCHGPGTANPDYQPIYLTNTAISNYYLRNASGDYATFDKCWKGTGWCRVEVCVAGDIASGQNVYTEARMTMLSDGDVYSARQGNRTNMGNFGGGQTGADLYHGQGPIGGLGGYYISHFMQASWSSDSGQWIGAANEIESGGGGGGVTPPPPPEPTPPAAPTLLPPDPQSVGAIGGVDVVNGVRLEVSALVSGGTVDVQSAITNGIGPYNVLTDCGNDGSWNGVANGLTSPSTSYACDFPSGTHDVEVQVWDTGANVTLNVDFAVTTN